MQNSFSGEATNHSGFGSGFNTPSEQVWQRVVSESKAFGDPNQNVISPGGYNFTPSAEFGSPPEKNAPTSTFCEWEKDIDASRFMASYVPQASFGGSNPIPFSAANAPFEKKTTLQETLSARKFLRALEFDKSLNKKLEDECLARIQYMPREHLMIKASYGIQENRRLMTRIEDLEDELNELKKADEAKGDRLLQKMEELHDLVDGGKGKRARVDTPDQWNV